MHGETHSSVWWIHEHSPVRYNDAFSFIMRFWVHWCRGRKMKNAQATCIPYGLLDYGKSNHPNLLWVDSSAMTGMHSSVIKPARTQATNANGSSGDYSSILTFCVQYLPEWTKRGKNVLLKMVLSNVEASTHQIVAVGSKYHTPPLPPLIPQICNHPVPQLSTNSVQSPDPSPHVEWIVHNCLSHNART